MLHADHAFAGGNRLVERVVGAGRSEHGAVTGAETRDRVGVERNLAHRAECQRGGRSNVRERALRRRIERPHGLQLVAEEVEPERLVGGRREDVDDAAAHGVLARFHDGFGAAIAGVVEGTDEVARIDPPAGLDRHRRCCELGRCRHALERAGDGGEYDAPALSAVLGKPPQAFQAAADDAGIRRYPIVRQAVPGGKFERGHVGREKRQRRGRLREHAVIRGDEQDVAHAAGQACQRQSFRAVWHAAQGGACADDQGRDVVHFGSLNRINAAIRALSWRAGGGSFAVNQA